jgi:hypothetical protein
MKASSDLALLALHLYTLMLQYLFEHLKIIDRHTVCVPALVYRQWCTSYIICIMYVSLFFSLLCQVLRQMSFHQYLCHQFSDTFDIYLEILHQVNLYKSLIY